MTKENKVTIDKMVEELKHYTNSDLMNCTINQIIEMYVKLFEGA